MKRVARVTRLAQAQLAKVKTRYNPPSGEMPGKISTHNQKPKMNKKTPKARGRKTALNTALIKKIVPVLKNGHTIETAAKFVGISKTTLYRWIEQGEQQESGEYRDFRDALAKARATAQVNLVDTLQRAAKTDWRAAAWLLERLFPEQFSNRERVDLSVNKGDNTPHITVCLPPIISTPPPIPRRPGQSLPPQT